MKRNPKTTLRNKADRLLQDYIKRTYTVCLVCLKPINAGHHFFTKKSSNALRYFLPNIVPLCKFCHCLVHSQPHLIVPKICFIKGDSWYEDLLTEKRKTIKANKAWYEKAIQDLEKL